MRRSRPNRERHGHWHHQVYVITADRVGEGRIGKPIINNLKRLTLAYFRAKGINYARWRMTADMI